MPGKLVDMKKTKKAITEQRSISVNEPEYPFGLNVDLDTESLEKLGIKENPKSGEKMTLLAKVEVTSESKNTSLKGKDRRRVSLQITEMALGPDAPKLTSGEKLYGGTK